MLTVGSKRRVRHPDSLSLVHDAEDDIRDAPLFSHIGRAPIRLVGFH